MYHLDFKEELKKLNKHVKGNYVVLNRTKEPNLDDEWARAQMEIDLNENIASIMTSWFKIESDPPEFLYWRKTLIRNFDYLRVLKQTSHWHYHN